MNQRLIEDSMIQLHKKKMRVNREHKALEILTAMIPELGKLARRFVLEETNFKIDFSFELINEYKEIYAKKIKAFSLIRGLYMKNIKKERQDRLLLEERKFTVITTYDLKNAR